MDIILRLLLTFNATIPMIVIFMVQKGFSLNDLIENNAKAFLCTPIATNDYSIFLCSSEATSEYSVFLRILSYLLYIIIPILITLMCLILIRKLRNDEFKKGSIVEIENANNSFLPSYLGYFFVALSIESCEIFIFTYLVLFFFTLLSQALYFNPLFLILGFDFYTAKTKNNTSIFLITKEKYKIPASINIKTAYRINNHTFIEKY